VRPSKKVFHLLGGTVYTLALLFEPCFLLNLVTWLLSQPVTQFD
jgi:hypothetical protein